MNSVINLLNSITDLLIGVINLPFSHAAPSWQLFWISFVSGILFLLIYGAISKQQQVKAVKTKISAALLEVALFRHDLGFLLRAQGNLFLHGLRYFLLAVPPILVLMMPCLLILSNLNLRFANRPLELGESALLTVELKDRKNLYRTTLEGAGGVDVGEPVRIAQNNQIVWRLKPTQVGDQTLLLKLGDSGAELSQTLRAAPGAGKLATASFAAWWDRLLYPDRSVDQAAGQVASIAFNYPQRDTTLLGLKMHWIAIFAIISILSGLVASRIFHIEI